MMRFLLLSLFFIISINNCLAEDKPEKQTIKFHPAETEAEKALDRILMKNNETGHHNVSECLLLYNKRINTHKKTEFNEDIIYLEYQKPDLKKLKFCRKYFTDKLMIKASEAERDHCNANEFGYEAYCWIDVDLVGCAQDIDEDGYLYYTIAQDATTAYIQKIFISWRDEVNFPNQYYYMKKDNNIWKMNNNSCINLDFTS